MLEEIAMKYISQTEESLHAIGYLIVVLGAIVAGAATESKTQISRAPYFALSALLILVASATQIIWIGSFAAMTEGYLWVLVAVDVISKLMIGFFFGQLAMARSRDAFGSSGGAVLAFIPIANFLLMFLPSKSEASSYRIPTIPLLRGGIGVLSALVMLVGSVALTAFVEDAINRHIKQAETDPQSHVAVIASMIRSQGLEATLRAMAQESPTPTTIDTVTTLARIDAEGTQLRRTFIVSSGNVSIDKAFRSKIENIVCAAPVFIPLFQAGASIREVYVKSEGAQLGAHVVTRETCGL